MPVMTGIIARTGFMRIRKIVAKIIEITDSSRNGTKCTYRSLIAVGSLFVTFIRSPAV